MSQKNLKQQAITQRRHARHQLLQSLYQWQLSGDNPDIVKENQLVDPQFREIDQRYFDQAWAYITVHHQDLAAILNPFASRVLNTLDPVERAILWIGAYELSQRPDIHPSVVINEAVELGKRFGSDDGYKFINATLDKFNKNRS